jgi:hypothetical protein
VNVPTRVAVSISTRFRTGRDIPFQFSTATEEVSVEKVSRYLTTAISRKKR